MLFKRLTRGPAFLDLVFSHLNTNSIRRYVGMVLRISSFLSFSTTARWKFELLAFGV